MINIKTFRKNERGQYLFESYKKILADIAREIFFMCDFFLTTGNVATFWKKLNFSNK